MTKSDVTVANADSLEEVGSARTLIGVIALRLREKGVLWITPLVAALLLPSKALLIQLFPDVVDKAGNLLGGWVVFNIAIPLGSFAIALSVILDKFADSHEKRQSALDVADALAQLKAAEDTAAAAVSSLTNLLAAAIRAATKRGTAHATLVEELAETLTEQAAMSIGTGTRATYYSLTRDEHGQRVLGSPVHATVFPRQDKPRREFSEYEQPDLSIWTMLDGADEEPEVRHFPEPVDDLDWTNKKYMTFYSIPVKSRTTQFGMLSVNNASDGSIGMTQRFVILAMARTFALVLASDQEAQTWLTSIPENDSEGS